MNPGRLGCKFRSTFTSLCIVELVCQFPCAVYGFLHNSFLDQFDCHRFFDKLLFLELFSCCLFQNVYAPIAVRSSFEGFLGWIFVEKFPTHGSFSSLLLAACVPRHWQQSVVQFVIHFNISELQISGVFQTLLHSKYTGKFPCELIEVYWSLTLTSLPSFQQPK